MAAASAAAWRRWSIAQRKIAATTRVWGAYRIQFASWHGFRTVSLETRPWGRVRRVRGLEMTNAILKQSDGGDRSPRRSMLAPFADAYAATARIKDIVDIEGVRENQLVGYGLVVGLNGTGDSLNNSPFTKQSLQAMLERLGVNTRGENMRTANVAAVMVTANLPAFATQGSRLDVSGRRARRCRQPPGRHAAGDPAARRRRRGLCHRPGPGADQRLQGRGRRRDDHLRRPDHRPHLQRRPDRARDRLRPRRPAHAAPRAPQPRPHHRAPHRALDQRLPRHAHARRPRIRRRSASTCPTTSTATSSTS